MSDSFWQRRLNKRMKSAIYWRQEDKLAALIEKGADVNKAPGHVQTPLLQATEENYTSIVALLLSKGADPNPKLSDSYAPLMVSLRHKNIESAKLLVNAGADLTKRDYEGATPLLLAAGLGAGDLIEMMVAKGADVNAKMKSGDTALHIVAAKGHANIARLLLDYGADRQAVNSSLNTAADVAERDFPRLALMIRANAVAAMPPVNTATPPVNAAPPPVINAAERPESKPAPDTVDTAGWTLTAPGEVAHVAEKPAIGYRITGIFNFSAGHYTQIAHNVLTGAESQVLRNFSELEDGFEGGRIAEAAAALVKLSGAPAPEIAPKAARHVLDKPVPRLPGA